MSSGEQGAMAIAGMAAWATIIAGLVVRTYGKAFCWGIVFWLLLALVPLGVLLMSGTPISGPKWTAYQLPRLPVIILR